MPAKPLTKKRISPKIGITIAVVIIVGAGIASYLLRQGIEEVVIPNIYITERDGKLIVGWRNLPDNVTEIRVARTNKDGAEEDWIVVQTGGLSSGEFIVGDITEEDRLFTYEFTAVSSEGGVVYQSQSSVTLNETLAGLPSAEPPATTSTPPAPAPTTPPSEETPPPVTTPPPTTPPAETTPPVTTPPPTTEPPPPQGEVYYTPEGGISGTGTVNTKTFWVAHRDNKILINWQNIPADTDVIIVYRSNSESTQGAQLIRQESVAVNYTISLLDNTIGTDQYYRMYTYKDGAQTGSYGPELLPALE